MEQSQTSTDKFLECVEQYDIFTFDEMLRFLSSDPRAGDEDFICDFLEAFDASSKISWGSEAHFMTRSKVRSLEELIESLSLNKFLTTEAYEAIFKACASNQSNYLLRSLRIKMFMNDNSVLIENKSALRKTFHNRAGSKAWMQCILDTCGDGFWAGGYDYMMFFEAGIITRQDICDNINGEVVSALLKSNNITNESMLLRVAVENCSRKTYYDKAPSKLHNFFDRKMNDKFFATEGVYLYEIAIKRAMSLFNDFSEKNSHSVALTNICRELTNSESAGYLSQAAYEFMRENKANRIVESHYSNMISRLSGANNDDLARWASIVSGCDTEDYKDLPNEWIMEIIKDLH